MYLLGKITSIARPIGIFLIGLMLCFMIGCAPSLSKKDDKELKTFLTDIKKQSEQRAALKAERLNKGIRKLSVEKSGSDFKISVDLADASLPAVLERLFNETSAPHVLPRELLAGKVTAKFENLSLAEALKALLSPLDLSVSNENGVIIIRSLLDTAAATEEPAADKDKAAQKAKIDGKPDILTEVLIYNTDASKVLKNLEDFYPKNPASPLKFSAAPNSNSILLSGSPVEVKRAAGIIRKTDRKPKHILIEASVVEVETSALLDLGIDISGAATGEFKNITTSFGSLTGTSLTFAWAKQTNPAALTAAINFLVSKEKARIITRPYLSAVSGEKATINITNDRYVIVNMATDGVAESTAVPIKSGAILEITPKAISDETILMNVNVEDSGFAPLSQNVAVEVDKNQASTIMQVDNGETIVIGGLTLDRQISEKSGVPLLSEIPLLNLLFGKETDSNDKKEVMIFITPHIWQPDISPPVIKREGALIKE